MTGMNRQADVPVWPILCNRNIPKYYSFVLKIDL